jgi:peptidoglycan/xylan/chitin deacetylase (PgdA/CDA1 family)
MTSRKGESRALRALTYHRFGDTRHDPFCVRPEDFDAQMAWLAERRCVVALEEVESFLRKDEALPEDSVLITIDDGYRSVHAQALPVLRRYRIPAVLFVTVDAIRDDGDESPGVGGDAPEPYLTWGELEELAGAGVAIESHAWTHRSLGRMRPNEAHEEAARSREILERHLGRQVTAFAYPFGTRADYTAETRAVLQQSGYRLAFTSQHGAIRPGQDSLTLPRVKVEGGEGMWMFRSLARGGLDGWSLVDQTLWRLQATSGGR